MPMRNNSPESRQDNLPSHTRLPGKHYFRVNTSARSRTPDYHEIADYERNGKTMAIGGSKGQFFSQINITPLTDVFLVLMVMMMLLAPITNVTGFTVFPPSPAVSRNYHGPRIKVEVAESGQIMINGNTLASPD